MATPSKRAGRATAGRVLVVETETPTETETEQKTEQETVGEEIISEVSAASGKSPESIIYRKDAETGEERWLAKVATSLVSHEWLAKKFGGGEYRVQHRKPNATGKMVYGGQDTIKIDPSVKPEVAVVIAPDGSPVAPGSSRIDAIMEAGVMSLIQQMQNANTTQMELVRSIVAERSNAKPGTDWVAVLTALSPIVAGLIPLLTNRPDTMTQAREIAELATKNQGAQGGLKDFIGAMKEMLEVRDLLGGGGDDDRSTGERLLESALPKFMELAERYAGNAGAVAPGPVIAPPVAAPALPSGQPQPVAQQQPMNWTAFVSRAVPRWIALAQRGKDPELYAEVEVDNMPPMFMIPLRKFLSSEGAYEAMLNAFPVLKDHEDWFRDFFETVTELVLPEEETDGTEDEEEDGGGEAEAGRESEASGGDAARSSVTTGGVTIESGSSHEDRPARSRGVRSGGRKGGADGGGEAADASDATAHRGNRRGG